MQIRTPLSTLLALAVLAACSDGTPVAPDVDAALSHAGEPIPTRQQERPGTLIELSDAEMWAHLQFAGGRAVVGLKAPGQVRGVWRGQILVSGAQKSQARGAVLAQRGVRLVLADDLLPLLEVEFASQEALAAVRRLGFVDYVEPVMVQDDLHTFAGVGGCGWGSNWTGDRQYTATGDVYSQKLTAMNIPAAQTLSNGAGVTIGLTDTGLASTNGQFFGSFTSGWSWGRTLRLFRVSSQSSAYDDCGHGTRMAGIMSAPWDGGSVGGIAYRSNLISVRQASGVAAVSSSDARASVRGAAQNGSQIVVMAWESLNWWWQVSDEIKYWHYNFPILFMGAAGTSGCGDGILDSNVVFPADMNEVVAVTGITFPGGGIPCGIHYGSQVELTAYLDVPTTGRYSNDVVGMGGSSNATAIAGSVAALVWSRTPGLTRDQLRARLQQSGSYWPNRHSREGFGLINAHKAVSGS
jgi:subtilisin family serine protease